MTKPALQQNSSRKVAWLIGMLALALSILTVSLVHYYGATRPTVKQEQEGRSHATKIHGRIVYLTTGEYTTAFALHAASVGAIGVFLGLLMKSRRGKDQASR
jgi:hypothetical protein